MVFAGLPALLQPTEDAAARLEQEVAEQQRKVEQLQRRDKVSSGLMAEQQAWTYVAVTCRLQHTASRIA
jgi:hypothetical protein